MRTLEVTFTPAEFAALRLRDLGQTVCVVFDVLRATSSIVTALGNGAAAVVPVEDIPEALALRKRAAEVLLAGERDGLRIQSELTGGVAFDLGNSPREFTREKVAGKTIAMTTTNGTRALRACAGAQRVLIGSLLNLGAVADYLSASEPEGLLLVCSGTFEEAAYEDVLGAGALCELVWPLYKDGHVADSAGMAHRLFEMERADLAGALSRSRNGRRLLSRPDLREDVAYCAELNRIPVLAEMDKSGTVRATQVKT
jgi:2-phosphosulfolactate phosphatase